MVFSTKNTNIFLAQPPPQTLPQWGWGYTLPTGDGDGEIGGVARGAPSPRPTPPHAPSPSAPAALQPPILKSWVRHCYKQRGQIPTELGG